MTSVKPRGNTVREGLTGISRGKSSFYSRMAVDASSRRQRARAKISATGNSNGTSRCRVISDNMPLTLVDHQSNEVASNIHHQAISEKDRSTRARRYVAMSRGCHLRAIIRTQLLFSGILKASLCTHARAPNPFEAQRAGSSLPG